MCARLLLGGILLSLLACDDGNGRARALFESGSARIAEGDYSGGVGTCVVSSSSFRRPPWPRKCGPIGPTTEELLAIEAARLPALAAADLRRLGTAVERYRDRHGQYQRSLGLLPLGPNLLPPHDSWGRPYRYRRTASWRRWDGSRRRAGSERTARSAWLGFI